MSFNQSTPSEVQSRLEAEASIASGTQHASLPGAPENMVSRMFNIVGSELYAYIEFLSNQIIPTEKTAPDWLDRHAGLWLATGRKSSGGASGPIVVHGAPGTIIEAATTMTRADGQLYRSLVDITIDGGGAGTGVAEALNSGLNTNTAAGIVLSLLAPIIGVSNIVVGADGLSGGANIEGDSSLLNRIRSRVQNPPHGGALPDYVMWAREVPGVTRAWAAESEDGVSTVLVTFVMDDKTDTIVPTLGELAAVEEYIDSVRPVGSHPEVFAPALEAVDLAIAVRPNTVVVQNAIRAELEDFFFREASADGVTLHLSRISEAISAGAGEQHHILISPSASVSFDFGTLPVLGQITWSAA